MHLQLPRRTGLAYVVWTSLGCIPLCHQCKRLHFVLLGNKQYIEIFTWLPCPHLTRYCIILEKCCYMEGWAVAPLIYYAFLVLHALLFGCLRCCTLRHHCWLLKHPVSCFLSDNNTYENNLDDPQDSPTGKYYVACFWVAWGVAYVNCKHLCKERLFEHHFYNCIWHLSYTYKCICDLIELVEPTKFYCIKLKNGKLKIGADGMAVPPNFTTATHRYK